MTARKIWFDRASVIVTLGAAIAGVVAGVITFSAEEVRKIEVVDVEFAVRPKESALSQQIENVHKEVSLLKVQVAELTKVPESVAISAKLHELDAKVAAVDEQLSALNKTIMASPEKALEVPMLRRDILAIQRQYESVTKSLEREITRAYDTIKWVIGTIVLGILGLAAGVFLRGKQD